MEFLLYYAAAFAAGFILDLIIGDPHGWPHMIRGFGTIISTLEKKLYRLKNKRLGGILLVIFTIIVCTLVPTVLLYFAWRVSPYAYFALESLIIWQLLATKSLRTESKSVYDALCRNDIAEARKAVSMIVGRDTETLDEAGVTRAAVETVAENASDGVGAPLFYIMLGGAALGCLYKAANTMDSMIGYKNERYIDFGRAAAKFDDIINFLPSRLCAFVMIFSSGVCGLDIKNAAKIWRRDRHNHASPNSAQTESVMAGALDVRLAGNACYFGVLHEKPYIGDDIRPITPYDIIRSHKLLYTTAIVMLILALAVRGCLIAAI